MRLRIFLLGAMVLGMAFGSPYGESAEEEIVIKGRYEEAEVEHPTSAVSVLEASEYEGRFATASEIITDAPGVKVTDTGGVGKLQTVSIRGSSAQQVLVLLDGVRMNTAQGGGFDFSTLPVGMIERIEVLRGGASALYGADAIGGVVNIVTKRPAEELSGEWRLSAGSFGTISSDLGFRQRLGRFDYVVSLSHQRTAGDFTFTTVNELERKRINNDSEVSEGLLKLGARLTEELEAALTFEAMSIDRGVPGLGEFQSPTARERDERNIEGLKLTGRGLLWTELEVELDMFRRYNRTRFREPSPPIGYPLDTDNRNTAYGTLLKAESILGERHLASLGLEGRWDSLEDPDYGSPRRESQAVSVGEEVTLLEDRLVGTLAGRVDWIKDDEGRSEREATGRVGLSCELTEWAKVKGNAGESFRPPSFDELYYPEEGYIGGNPELEPEKARNFDLGAELHWSKAMASVTWFRNEIEDSIIFAPVSAFRIEPLNTGEATSEGFEVELQFRPADWFSISGSYTETDARLEETGIRLPGRPEDQATVRAKVEMGETELFCKGLYLGRTNLNMFGSKWLDERMSWDFGVSKRFSEKVMLTAEVKNAFDEDMRDFLDMPLPGRSFFLTFETKL